MSDEDKFSGSLRWADDLLTITTVVLKS